MLAPTATAAGPNARRLDAALAGKANVVERLPTLALTLARAGELCAEGLGELSAKPALLTLKGIENGTVDAMLGADGGLVTGVLYATKWDARLLVSLRQDAILALLELAFGGDGSEPADLGTRPLSKIEMRFARRFLARIAAALGQAFAGVAETPFVLEASEAAPDGDDFQGAQAAVAIARYHFEWCGRGGEIGLCLPQSTLAELRTVLSVVPNKEKLRPADPNWVQRIEQEITRSRVVLSAILDERPMLLGEVMNLRVGQLLSLAATAHSRLAIECNNERIMWCHLGKSNDVYTLRVDRQVDHDQEFMDEILSR
ncbi:MAG TPA: FliM/FliN family flagellar motor switch protein [Hyphomicrobiaceae bacterium]|nr:FliM/FliN family flagellar motor switch protein [Hyphomicrobiaceae bacterium]